MRKIAIGEILSFKYWTFSILHNRIVNCVYIKLGFNQNNRIFIKGGHSDEFRGWLKGTISLRELKCFPCNNWNFTLINGLEMQCSSLQNSIMLYLSPLSRSCKNRTSRKSWNLLLGVTNWNIFWSNFNVVAFTLKKNPHFFFGLMIPSPMPRSCRNRTPRKCLNLVLGVTN